MYNRNTVLKAVRENQNVTPEDVAERLDILPKEYLKLENGEKRITIDIAKRLGDIFNIDPEYFFVQGAQAVNYNTGPNSHGGPFMNTITMPIWLIFVKSCLKIITD